MDPTASTNIESALSRQIIACGIAVHRALGPGLLESVYRACLVHELDAQGLHARCEVPIPVRYGNVDIETSYRADVIVEDTILLELKAADQILAIHEAQILTYLKLSKLRVGLLLNFNVTRLHLGVHRFVR